MVAAVGDHAEHFVVESRDDRHSVRKRPAHGDVKRSCDQGRRGRFYSYHEYLDILTGDDD